MEEIFFKLIAELNGSVFVLVAILLAVFYLIYLFGQWKEKFKNQDDKISEVRTISDKVIRLETKVDLIYQNTNPKSLTANQSPIALTEKGREISNEINAEKIFEKHLPKLKAFVKDKKPKNAYDIQRISMEIATSKMADLLSQDELVSMKDHAFKQGLLIEDIMRIFGLLLRDVMLVDENIPIHEVDAHDPNNQ